MRTTKSRQREAAFNFTLHVATLGGLMLALGGIPILLSSPSLGLTPVQAAVLGLTTMFCILLLGAMVVLNMGIQYLPRNPTTIERFQHWLYHAL